MDILALLKTSNDREAIEMLLVPVATNEHFRGLLQAHVRDVDIKLSRFQRSNSDEDFVNTYMQIAESRDTAISMLETFDEIIVRAGVTGGGDRDAPIPMTDAQVDDMLITERIIP